MSIVVTKCSPEVVGPSEPGTLTDNIQLSCFDIAVSSAAVSSLLVFDEPIVNPVETIRRALSRALVHYYPISGRHAAGCDGGEVITCTAGEGQGVLFVGASASCAVDNVQSTELLKELFVHYPEEFYCRHVDPLLLMQVTEFTCGGFVVGVTWNHVLADGAGIGQFLQAVGELARGMSLPSIVPVRSDDLVLAAHPQGMTAADFVSAEVIQDDMPFVDFTVPSSLITRIKTEVSCALGKPCTVFEAVVAIVWQCRARAVFSDGSETESTATLVFGNNVRDLVGAARGYYGNCSMAESVIAATTQLANGDTKDVVNLIKMGKQKMQDHIKNKKGDGVEPVRQPQQQLGYNTLVVSSWRNIGLEVADFGGGRAARVMWYGDQAFMPAVVLCPPCKVKGDGVNVLGYIGKKEHVDAFMQELAALEPGCERE